MKRTDVMRGLEEDEAVIISNILGRSWLILVALPQLERVKRASIGQSFGSGDETAVSLKVLVSNKLVGGVIGKAGATINIIKEASGAKVKVRLMYLDRLMFSHWVSELRHRFPITLKFFLERPIA